MPTVASLQTMGAYPTAGEGIWSFPFALTFDKAIWDPSTLVFQLQVDTFPTFASPNLVNVYSNGSGIVEFQNGPLGKAISVNLTRRQLNLTATWYWRVRIMNYGYAGGYTSNWSNGSILTVPPDQSVAFADTMFGNIADQYSYSKAAKSSNVYRMLEILGRIFDQLALETNYSQRDLILDQARDQGIQTNFAPLVELSQTSTEPNASFRWKVHQLFKAFVDVPGVLQGITQAVTAFVGEPPTILDTTNTIGWILPINYIKAPNYPNLQPTIKLYDLLNKGFNWTLLVFNSWNLTYDVSVLENYVNMIKPAHTKTIFQFPTQKHAQIRLNTAADWNACTLTNTTVNSAGGLTLGGGQTSGTAETPIFSLPWTLSGWDTLQATQIVQSTNQTIVYQIKSASSFGGSFSGYETVPLGQSPVSTPLNSFVRIKITMTTTSSSIQPILNELDMNLVHA